MFHAQSKIHSFRKFLNYGSEKKHKQLKLVHWWTRPDWWTSFTHPLSGLDCVKVRIRILVRSRRSDRHSTDSLLSSVPLAWHHIPLSCCLISWLDKHEPNTKTSGTSQDFPQRYFQLPVSCRPGLGHTRLVQFWLEGTEDKLGHSRRVRFWLEGERRLLISFYGPFPEKWGERRRWVWNWHWKKIWI
jgi:hypothetical protein